MHYYTRFNWIHCDTIIIIIYWWAAATRWQARYKSLDKEFGNVLLFNFFFICWYCSSAEIAHSGSDIRPKLCLLQRTLPTVTLVLRDVILGNGERETLDCNDSFFFLLTFILNYLTVEWKNYSLVFLTFHRTLGHNSLPFLLPRNQKLLTSKTPSRGFLLLT